MAFITRVLLLAFAAQLVAGSQLPKFFLLTCFHSLVWQSFPFQYDFTNRLEHQLIRDLRVADPQLSHSSAMATVQAWLKEDAGVSCTDPRAVELLQDAWTENRTCWGAVVWWRRHGKGRDYILALRKALCCVWVKGFGMCVIHTCMLYLINWN